MDSNNILLPDMWMNDIAEKIPMWFESARLYYAYTCDFYIDNTPADGVPYWDTGAPNLYKLGDYLNKPADPFNVFEPVDSSAADIGAQGLLRLGIILAIKAMQQQEKNIGRQALPF